MPKAFAWILVAVTVIVLALFGLAIAVALTTQDRPSGSLDTDLEGVTVSTETTTEPAPEPPPEPVGDRRCWNEFGADPRAVARPPAGDSRPPGEEVHLDARARTATSSSRPCTATARSTSTASRGRRSPSTSETGKVRWTRPSRRHASLEPGDRRASAPRRLAGRDGDRALPGLGAPALAGSHGGEGRVVARGRRRARVLRLARRPGLRGAIEHRSRRLGVPDGRAHQCEPHDRRRVGVRDQLLRARSSASIAGRAPSAGRRT